MTAPVSPTDQMTPSAYVRKLMDDSALEHLFTYHPPTDETRTKYAATQAAYDEAVHNINFAINDSSPERTFERVTSAALAFARVINDQCPPCADATAAIRCVRLARMAANRLVMEFRKPEVRRDSEVEEALRSLMVQNLISAHFQANAAIALG